MASSGAMSSSPQRFYDYLNCLREEFENRSNDSSPHRFNIFLQNLKGEFELKSLEIESLRKERDRYREKAEVQLKKPQDVRRNFVCERCCIETTSAAQIVTSSKPTAVKTTLSSFSTPFFQSKAHNKPARGVDSTTRYSTQRTTFLQKLSSIVHATTKLSDTNSRFAALSSSLPQASASTDNPDPGREDYVCSIKFKDEVEKELDMEITHTLSHGATIGCVKFSRDGKYLAAGCSDGKAYIYDVRAGTLTRVLRNLLAEEDLIRTVCFSRDGEYLATGSWKGELYIWKITTKYVRNAFKGPTGSITSLDFSPNGRLLVSTSYDNTVWLWNMHDGATRLLAEDYPTFRKDPAYTSAVFSPDGRYVAASHRDGMVRIWDVCTGHLTRRMKAHVDWAACVAFMPDGKGLVSGDCEGKLSYWDVSSLDSTRFRGRSQRSGVEEQTRPEREFIGHEDFVGTLAISPDGRWVASGSYDKSARIWDIRNAAMQCILDHNEQIRTVDFSPGGFYLALGGQGGTLGIWRYSNVASTGS